MKRLRITFTRHALYQIKERKLSTAQIEQVINQPDKVITQTNDRFLAYKLFKKSGKSYLLIAIYERTNSSITIITTFLTSKLHKYL